MLFFILDLYVFPCSTAVAGLLSPLQASLGIHGQQVHRCWRCLPVFQTVGPGYLWRTGEAIKCFCVMEQIPLLATVEIVHTLCSKVVRVVFWSTWLWFLTLSPGWVHRLNHPHSIKAIMLKSLTGLHFESSKDRKKSSQGTFSCYEESWPMRCETFVWESFIKSNSHWRRMILFRRGFFF